MTVAFVIPGGNENFPFDEGHIFSILPFLLTFKCTPFSWTLENRAIVDLLRLDALTLKGRLLFHQAN